MAQKAVMMNEMVNAEDINPKDIRCPRCKGQTLILRGNFQIAHEEILQEGKLVESKSMPETGAFELEIMDCTACSVRFLIKPKEVYELEAMNLLLRNQVIELGGKDPFGVGLVC